MTLVRTSLPALFLIGAAAVASADTPTPTAGVALGLGESAAIMKNERGVMMEIELQEVGLRFNLAATGAKIAMAGERHCKAAKSAVH